jgi:predicted nucleic acid-binding protein
MVWAEVLSGIKILPEGKRKSELLNFFIESVQKMYEIVPFDASCASIYSDILQRLKENDTPAPKLDMLIAASAIANNLILVTRNTADFEPIAKVSNLMMENWF